MTAGSLKVAESRVIADLLLKQAEANTWKSALGRDNLLQARSPATAQRLSRLIRNRLETMTPDLWKLVRDGSATVATHACLAAAATSIAASCIMPAACPWHSSVATSISRFLTRPTKTLVAISLRPGYRCQIHHYRTRRTSHLALLSRGNEKARYWAISSQDA